MNQVLLCSLTLIIIPPSSPAWQRQHASGSWPWWWHGAYAGAAVAAAAAGPWGSFPPSPKSPLASVWASWWGGSRRWWGSGHTWRSSCGRRGSSPLRWPSPGTRRGSAAASSRHRQLKQERGRVMRTLWGSESNTKWWIICRAEVHPHMWLTLMTSTLKTFLNKYHKKIENTSWPKVRLQKCFIKIHYKALTSKYFVSRDFFSQKKCSFWIYFMLMLYYSWTHLDVRILFLCFSHN